MPGRSTGNARESSVCDALDKLGYYVVQLKGSGARGARMRRRKHSVIGDMLAISENGNIHGDSEGWQFSSPWLQIEAGAHSAKAAFKALRAHPLPGFTPIAVLWVYRATRGSARAKRPTRRWYVDEHVWFKTAEEALVEIQARR